ncbi:MAG: hypothetical protein WAO02_01170 [Verrucomicrobiia bacterium]
MRSLFIFISNRVKQMPFGIRLLSVLCVFAPTFGLWLHFQSADGLPDYVGLPKVLLIAICSAVFLYGFLLAARWSRPLLMLYLAVGSIWAIFQHHATYSFTDYLGLLATDAFIVWILCFRRDVRDYYARAHESLA